MELPTGSLFLEPVNLSTSESFTRKGKIFDFPKATSMWIAGQQIKALNNQDNI